MTQDSPAALAPHGLSMTEISHAIGLCRIVLIVGLVFLHYGTFPNSAMTPFQGLDLHEHRFATWLNSAILFSFFSAVPLLSMISGWLFFSFLPENAWPAIFRRLRKRFFSLYMPLVVWNAGYLVLFYLYYRTHPTASLFTHTTRLQIDFATAGPWQYFDAVTGITQVPFAFQFWFVRDLFVTTLVSPLLWVLIRRVPWIGLAGFAVIWLSGYNMVIFFRPDVPFFFFLGALLHDRRVSLTIPLRTAVICFILFVCLAGIRALAPCVVTFSGPENPLWLEAATRLMRLLGVIGCWGLLYRAARTPCGTKLAAFGGLAFFLHSAHFPLLAVVKAGLWKLMPGQSDFWMLLHDFASVAVTVTIGISAGLALAHFAPRVFALMNGGRNLSQSMDRAKQ